MSRNNNITNIDGSEYKGHGKNKYSRFPNLTPAFFGAAIFVLVFIYLCINLYLYYTREQVPIYEVQAEELSFDVSFPAVCLRSESLIRTEHSGYISYYVQNLNKAAKNSIVYSVDNGSNVHTKLEEEFSSYSFDNDEIREIKALINSDLKDFDGTDMSRIETFENNLSETLFDFTNANKLESMKAYIEADNTGSQLYAVRTPVSGIISFKSDGFENLTVDDISGELLQNHSSTFENLKSVGLVSVNDPIYRICTSEDWTIIAGVSEDFYVNNLENTEVGFFIDDSVKPLRAKIRLFSRGAEYFAELSVSDYMSAYMDKRFVNVRFEQDNQNGLKIPISSIAKKGYYLIPISMFCNDENYKGTVLKREIYNMSTGLNDYESLYFPKYYTDGYYAYIDMNSLSEGDFIYNSDTGERIKVATVNYLEGVYCVNKGYYVFTRIERLRSNSEYTIVRKDTPEGLELYDHIALNAADAVDGAIIYK